MKAKTKTVQSKYANPDKFINKLKYEIQRLELVIKSNTGHINRLANEKQQLEEDVYGVCWFSYKEPGHQMGVNLNGHGAIKELEKMKIGTKIICFGEVVGYTRSKEAKNEADMIIKDVYIKRD